jgi:TonB-linked SusC/RagA family outer membrane protein
MCSNNFNKGNYVFGKYVLATFCLFLFALKLSAQPKVLKGRIENSETKEAVQGASISTKDAKSYTVSNPNGSFEILIPDTVRLIIINHIGFHEQQVTLQDGFASAPLLISLAPKSIELQEVLVSTGYEMLPKERSTGSFAFIDEKLFNQRVTTNVIERLEGLAGGLLFGKIPAAPELTVRGVNSIFSGKDPLIVVDNFPYQGSVENINPSDVESITILRDAAAASIWGSKAGNGVIVITTKKGKLSQHLSISVTSNFSLVRKPDVFKLLQMNPADFASVEKMLFEAGFYQAYENDPSHSPFTPVVETLRKLRDNQISEEEANRSIEEISKHDLRNDLDKHWYQNGIKKQFNINIQSGGTNSAWVFSVGYDRNNSVTADDLRRYNFRVHNSWKPIKNLQFNSEILYTSTRLKAGRPDFSSVNSIHNNQKILYPYAALAGNDGTALPVINDYRRGFTDTAGGGRLLDWNYYPLDEYNHIKNITDRTDILINTMLSYGFSKSLQAEVRYQYERQQLSQNTEYGVGSYYTRNQINRFAQRTSGTTLNFAIPQGAILDEAFGTIEAHSFRTQLNFKRNWDKFSVTSIGGVEIRESEQDRNVFRTYGYNPDNLTRTAVDHVTLFSLYHNPSVRQRIPPNRVIAGLIERNLSAFANVGLDYQDKYTFTTSIRKDQSNLFGVLANKRGVPLWSTGVAWNLLNESFIKFQFLNQLKLRATFGLSGNVDANRTAITTYTFSSGNLNNAAFASIRNNGNPLLRWEKIAHLNLGIDFGLSNKRLSGKIEYYTKWMTDLTAAVPIDYTSGIQTIAKNVADMRSKGFDIELNGNIGTGDFTWQPTIIVSHVKNKIGNAISPTNLNASAYLSGTGLTALPGKSPYSVLSYRWGGLNELTGDPQGYLDGRISTDWQSIYNQTSIDDAVYHGSRVPVVFGTVRNTINWKQISLSATLLFKGGHFFRRSSISYVNLYYYWIGHSDYEKRWKQPGDEMKTNVPSQVYPANTFYRDDIYNYSEATVEKADNLRLQDISVTYFLGKKAPFSGQIYLLFNNIGMIWKANKVGLDPDYVNVIAPRFNSTIGFRITIK